MEQLVGYVGEQRRGLGHGTAEGWLMRGKDKKMGLPGQANGKGEPETLKKVS
jgi:hypothetical protein